jgi:large subunit ribosomal protein L35
MLPLPPSLPGEGSLSQSFEKVPMGYKFKPNKSVAKRFKVTGTGKLKRGSGKRSHLQSARDAKTRRQLRKPEVLHEGHARNMRLMMGISGKRPNQIAHDRKLDAEAMAEAGVEAPAAVKAPAKPAAKAPAKVAAKAGEKPAAKAAKPAKK